MMEKFVISESQINELVERLRFIQKNTPQGLLDLSNYGWFLGFDSMPADPIVLRSKIDSGKIEEVDKFLIEYYEGTLENVERRLILESPSRETIFKEAFQNHRDGRYYSSITLLLTQADGICFDKFGVDFFKNRKEDGIFFPKVKGNMDLKDLGLLNTFKVLFSQSIAINDHSNNEEIYPVFLNRHNILHGHKIEFGSKKNSLKIISFLNYINSLIAHDGIERNTK